MNVEFQILEAITIIFCSAAVISTLALFTRQSLMVSYMAVGLIAGPWGFRWVDDLTLIKALGEIGIIFLLFLLGLHLDPHTLLQKLRKSSIVALASSLIFLLLGYLAGVYLLNEPPTSSFIFGLCMMFSSTIICLKLMPSNLMYNQNLGSMMISVLLLQDVLAILVIVLIKTLGGSSGHTVSNRLFDIVFLAVSFPFLMAFGFWAEHFILLPLFRRFEKTREYLFLLTIAWCLAMGVFADWLGLSGEVGAFIAGVSIASSSRISHYLVECMRPLRDFFLVMFFFTVGARFNTHTFWPNASVIVFLSVVVFLIKPMVYRVLFWSVGEEDKNSWQLGFRLGQGSEFSLLLYQMAMSNFILSTSMETVVQGVTILTFIFSSYFVSQRYQTPDEDVSERQID